MAWLIVALSETRLWSRWSVGLVVWDCGVHSVFPLMDKDKRLTEASWWERLRGKLGLVLMGRAMLSKSLIQFSVDGQSSVPSLLFDLRPNYGGGNEDNGNLLQKDLDPPFCIRVWETWAPQPLITTWVIYVTYSASQNPISLLIMRILGFSCGSDSKLSACNSGHHAQFLGWEYPLEKGMDPL